MEKKYYAIITGELNIFSKRSRDAVKYITSQDGFVGVHLMDGRMAFLFDSRNNAVGAMNMSKSVGILTSKEVHECYADIDGEGEAR